MVNIYIYIYIYILKLLKITHGQYGYLSNKQSTDGGYKWKYKS